MSLASAHKMALPDLFKAITPAITADFGAVPNIAVSGISLDTRLLQANELYLALPGATAHGLQFVAKAIENGVAAIATDAPSASTYAEQIALASSASIPVFFVENLKANASVIASTFYGQPSQHMKVVAVTGTDGKTSVCQFVAQALQSMGEPCGYIGTLGWGLKQLNSTDLTTPDAVSLQQMLANLHAEGASVVALEASSHGLQEGRLDAIHIDVAVLTNFGRDHLDYHKTIEAYREAKAALFDWPSLSAVVLNGSDSLGASLAANTTLPAVVFYSDDTLFEQSRVIPEVELEVDSISLSDQGIAFELFDNGESFVVNSQLMGRFNIENLMACHGVLRALGHAANDASAALQNVTAVAGRMERFDTRNHATAIVDYAHTPQALESVLSSAREHCEGELWVVFGCGGDRDAGKRAPMGRAAEAADRIVVTDDNPRTESSASIIAQIIAGMASPERAVQLPDRESAIRYALTHASAADLVVVAGKGHEPYQIVGTQKRDFSDRDTVVRLMQEAS